MSILALTMMLAGCSGDGGDSSQSHSTARSGQPDANPLAGRAIYVDPASPPVRQALTWSRQGRAGDAKDMTSLASRPTATWIADGPDVAGWVRSLVMPARQAGKTRLLVAYDIPGRDCGSYSAGGAPSADAYRGWVRAFARGLGGGSAVVILEPDAIPQAVEGCLSPTARKQRYRLLRFAVRQLSARPGTSVYLDAGNVGWIHPPSRLVGPLRQVGIGAAAGFALNVSNYYRTSESVRYGRELSRLLGGAHFVIDTGRNGNGSAGAGKKDWCNPPGRALGRDPTTDTGQEGVDAFLWVKEPGTSDGACRGGPPAGRWWPQNALELVRNTS